MFKYSNLERKTRKEDGRKERRKEKVRKKKGKRERDKESETGSGDREYVS